MVPVHRGRAQLQLRGAGSGDDSRRLGRRGGQSTDELRHQWDLGSGVGREKGAWPGSDSAASSAESARAAWRAKQSGPGVLSPIA